MIKDFLTSFAVKITSIIILGAGSTATCLISYGMFKQDYIQVKERVSALESGQVTITGKIDEMSNQISFMAGQMGYIKQNKEKKHE